MSNFENNILKIAEEIISSEANSVKRLINYLDKDFVKSVQMILKSKGRVIVTGIGKSANIAHKIVATLNSTGTPAIFMHAADAIHGDLGTIQQNDTIICLSKSGNTPEIRVLIPLIKKMGNSILAMVSNLDSFLAQQADYVLKAIVKDEACPNNLAPTNSTTAQLVLGDALAVCLLKSRNFTREDFARFHPGGTLGKKLYTRVIDLMISLSPPRVSPLATINEVILEISSKRLGATAVVDKNEKLLGIITDGDLRRMLEKHPSFEFLSAQNIMTKNPKTTFKTELAVNAYDIMEKNSITQLAVIDENQKYLGIIHLHDVLKEGIV